MEVLQSAPKAADFIPLAEHQSTTPASFYSGPPILYHLSSHCKILISQSELSSSPALNSLYQGEVAGSTSNGDMNGDHEVAEEVEIRDVDVWVTSAKLLLWSHPTSKGLSIPYPSISLHAIQTSPSSGQSLYMQLITSSPDDLANGSADDDEMDIETITLSILATSQTTDTPTPAPTDSLTTAEEETPSATQALFTALSECSNLHPDPTNEDDEDGEEGSVLMNAGLVQAGSASGGLPPAMPGSGGWITAENMHEYIDAEGNFIGGDVDGEETEDLGPGAGTVRAREEDADGQGEGDGEETKWRRTE